MRTEFITVYKRTFFRWGFRIYCFVSPRRCVGDPTGEEPEASQEEPQPCS